MKFVLGREGGRGITPDGCCRVNNWISNQSHNGFQVFAIRTGGRLFDSLLVKSIARPMKSSWINESLLLVAPAAAATTEGKHEIDYNCTYDAILFVDAERITLFSSFNTNVAGIFFFFFAIFQQRKKKCDRSTRIEWLTFAE